jgi:hypothetical protein
LQQRRRLKQEQESRDSKEEFIFKGTQHRIDTPPPTPLIHKPPDIPEKERKIPRLPSLPILRDKIQLESHLMICETLLSEEGVNIERLSAKVSIAESCKEVPAVMASINSLLVEPWNAIKKSLLAEFCDCNLIRSQLESMIHRVRFDNLNMIAFVHEARRLWSLRSSDIDQRWFITNLFKTVPSEILEDLIQRVRSRDGQRDWMSHDVYFLLEVLTNIVISKNAVYAVKGMDSLRYSKEVYDNKPKGDQGGGELRHWIAQQPGAIYYLKGSIDQAHLNQVKRKAVIVKQCRRKRDNAVYYLGVFETKEQGQQILENILPVADFRFFERKN